MHSIETKRPAVAGREGVRELVRRPLVKVLLTVSAVAQVVAVGANARQAGKAEPDVVAQLTPWVVEAPAVAPAKATPVALVTSPPSPEAEVTALAADYRAQGFEVSGSLARTINEAAQENGIDSEIAFGLVRAESGFKNSATSRVGAVGLTQLMPGTARWMEPGVTRSELRDPKTNARIGFKYLRHLIDRYEGNVDLALTAYNRGPGTVDRVLKRGGNPDNGYADFVRTGKRGRHRG